ncbi:MAG: hypothetical protein NTX86_04450 [Candidatus Dependentiae bacterium]|nr:hypothetical protein [Candidatus Dependentiae bacterium]
MKKNTLLTITLALVLANTSTFVQAHKLLCIKDGLVTGAQDQELKCNYHWSTTVKEGLRCYLRLEGSDFKIQALNRADTKQASNPLTVAAQGSIRLNTQAQATAAGMPGETAQLGVITFTWPAAQVDVLRKANSNPKSVALADLEKATTTKSVSVADFVTLKSTLGASFCPAAPAIATKPVANAPAPAKKK